MRVRVGNLRVALEDELVAPPIGQREPAGSIGRRRSATTVAPRSTSRSTSCSRVPSVGRRSMDAVLDGLRLGHLDEQHRVRPSGLKIMPPRARARSSSGSSVVPRPTPTRRTGRGRRARSMVVWLMREVTRLSLARRAVGIGWICRGSGGAVRRGLQRVVGGGGRPGRPGRGIERPGSARRARPARPAGRWPARRRRRPTPSAEVSVPEASAAAVDSATASSMPFDASSTASGE